MPNTETADFLKPLANGRVFASLAATRAASLEPGDMVLARDMAEIAPADAFAAEAIRGKWHLRPYRLADGQSGRLLMVNDVAGEEGAAAIPPELSVDLDLPGWYAIWIGIPQVDLRPLVQEPQSGVDVALDDEPFVPISGERGTRKKRLMGPMNVELFCFWKCARLDGRTLRIRVRHGTFVSYPWGLVRGSISALRLVKLSEAQVAAYRSDISDPSTKRVIVVNDGFSHYWGVGEPGKGIDASFAQAYRDSDVKMIFLQTPSTGVASWPTRLTSLVGEDVDSAHWEKLRLGDRRVADYVRWAVETGNEGFRVMSDVCRQSGTEFHASLRMNLFWSGREWELLLGGRWWRDHPEVRLPNNHKIDYALPEARRFIIGLLAELAARYDVDGINLDFTRWPPVADPARHEPDVLTSFIVEVRQALDGIAREKRRNLALSASIVDGYHARTDLEGQKIDLEAWLATGALSFIAVQAWDQAKYLALARKYRTPYYCIWDNVPFTNPSGNLGDPEWQEDHDPLPGEELESEPYVNNGLDPTECDEGFPERYRSGADGICLVNIGGWRFIGRLGHVAEMERRAGTGQVWGLEVGPGITID